MQSWRYFLFFYLWDFQKCAQFQSTFYPCVICKRPINIQWFYRSCLSASWSAEAHGLVYATITPVALSLQIDIYVQGCLERRFILSVCNRSQAMLKSTYIDIHYSRFSWKRANFNRCCEPTCLCIDWLPTDFS
jgi:hypothetical protein